MVLLDELDALCVNVQNGTTSVCGSIGALDAFGGYVGDGFGGGAVAVAAELGVLEEGTLLDEVFEFGLGDVVVGLAAHLPGSGVTSRVWRKDRWSAKGVQG